MVEIGGGEPRIPDRCEPPRSIVEALSGHIDVVAVEHAVDEPGRNIAARQPRGSPADMVEQSHRAILARLLAIEMAEDITKQPPHAVLVAQIGQALKAADADMAMAQTHQYGRAGGGGFVATLKLFAGLDQRETARRLDAQRLEHLGRQHLAHAALQRQTAVAEAAPGRLA